MGGIAVQSDTAAVDPCRRTVPVLGFGMSRRYLVATDHGDVVVEVNEAVGGLDPELFTLRPPEAVEGDLGAAVPLRAFGAKVVDLVELMGVGELPGGERLRRMMVQERATEALRSIERWARDRAGAS